MNIAWTGANDVNIQAAALPNWQQSYCQLSPGSFRGRVGVRGNICFSVFLENTNTATEQLVSSDIPLSFGVLMGSAGHALLDGKRIGADDVMVIRRGVPFHFVMPAKGWIAALQCHDASIIRLADGILCQDGQGAPINQVIRNSDLSRVVRQILVEELRSDRRLASDDPRQGERLEPLRRALAMVGQGGLAHRSDSGLRGKWHITLRAKRLMDTEDGHRMGIADMAGALGLSERTLNYAFAAVFDMSPKTYFTLVRLNGFRRDLQREEPRSGMVADLALKWGFSHFGRLSENYRKFYGETPSETVRLRNTAGLIAGLAGRKSGKSLIIFNNC